MGHGFAESVAEEALLEWLAALGWTIAYGPDLAPGEPASERATHGDVVLRGRLHAALTRLNPTLPPNAIADAERRLARVDVPGLVAANRATHRLLVDGIPVEVPTGDGRVRGVLVRAIDFDDPANNDWLCVNQFTVTEGTHKRRPDVVLFVNGLPLVVVELKSPSDENATIWAAHNQLGTYMAEIPSLFRSNGLLVISDGLVARVGSITSPRERFAGWRTVDGVALAPAGANELDVLAKGVFDHARLLEMLRQFIVFEDEHGETHKKIAGYHQFHATRRAVASTITASAEDGDRRVGVVWHTQGSGKSLTMLFFAGKLVVEPALRNPTIVILTDRNDLDDQLYGVFARCSDLIRQTPARADTRAELRDLLGVASGGVVFTTVQKFFPDDRGDRHPLLSDRRNIVVIADEAHRSQYGFVDGFAAHLRDALPNASFVAFTGTPVELGDRDTRSVFGDYIDIYDIEQSVADGATVPIYYESRLAKLRLDERAIPTIDADFEEVTEGEEVERREKLKSKWAQVEAVVGSERRIREVAEDLVAHLDARQSVMAGKAMVVCMSRRICVDLHREIVRLRPEWEGADDESGEVKVVMTGSASDPVDWQQHIRNRARREVLATRFKRPDDPFRLVIVRDMWLTGFDVPSLHTLYVDKPMHGHALMQAIARVNRVFRDKPGGLVVDYLGLAEDLRAALAAYTQSGGKGAPTRDQGEAVAVMFEKLDICRGLLHGFDYTNGLHGSATERLTAVGLAVDHVTPQDGGRERFTAATSDLSRVFALAVPREETRAAREEVAFMQAVRAAFKKLEPGAGRDDIEMEHAIRQIVSDAIAPDGVVDIFAAAGLEKPDLSILSDEFLADVRDMPQRNLAVELLRKLLGDEIAARRKTNLVQSRSFAALLQGAIGRYKNRAIQAAQVIEELIALAREMNAAERRGDDLGLSAAELAFYDALETNDSAVQVLGDETLRAIARELTETVRRNTTIDWSVKESVRADLRRRVKRILAGTVTRPISPRKRPRPSSSRRSSSGSRWPMSCPPSPPTASRFRASPRRMSDRSRTRSRSTRSHSPPGRSARRRPRSPTRGSRRSVARGSGRGCSSRRSKASR